MDSTQKGQRQSSCQYGCDGSGLIIKEIDGREVGVFCKCREEKEIRARFKNASIPEEYENARFSNFEVNDATQEKLMASMKDYLKDILAKSELEKDRMGRIKLTGSSIGYLSEYGEMRLKELSASERMKVKTQKNSYGIGKTHIQISAAKYLINKGYRVFVINDSTYMQELMSARQMGDQQRINDLVGLATVYADVVVWDEIGRSKYSEAKEDMYFQIINELYKQQKRVLFSSNEDFETLEFKIGMAAFSRLRGMAKGNLYALSGKDMR